MRSGALDKFDRLYCGWMAHYTLDLAAFRNAKNRDNVVLYAYACGNPQHICDRYDRNSLHRRASVLALDPVSGHSLFGYHAHCARRSNQLVPCWAIYCDFSRNFLSQFQPRGTADHPPVLDDGRRGLLRSRIFSLYLGLTRLYRYEFFSGGLETTSHIIPRRDHIATLDAGIPVYNVVLIHPPAPVCWRRYCGCRRLVIPRVAKAAPAGAQRARRGSAVPVLRIHKLFLAVLVRSADGLL